MNQYLSNIVDALNKKGVVHTCSKDSIRANLPDGFGVLEVKILGEKEDSIQHIEGDFHTHGDQLAAELNRSQEDAIATLFDEAINGKLFLIEEQEPGKIPRKTIQESMERYLKYLPKGTEYKVAKKI